MKENIKSILHSSISLKLAVADDAKLVGQIGVAATALASASKRGGTIFACGNGGSSCDAMHLCEELVARYKRDRPGIKALHFTDPATMTCWGNDASFDQVFSRWAETFCTAKDVLVAISTSGNSPNVIEAVKAAKSRKTKVIGLLGKGGGKLAPICDIALVVPSMETERIQEVHITIIHIWCELLETVLGLGPQKRNTAAKPKTKRKGS